MIPNELLSLHNLASYLCLQALWDDYMDVPRQREKQTSEIPVQSRDSQLPQKLLRQTCKYHNIIVYFLHSLYT